MSIFISLASYCDPVLPFTIEEAYKKARWPDELHFGICDQNLPDAPYPVPSFVPDKQVSYVKIDSRQARGCSWARSVVMSMMGHQDWFFQIDSHMMFEENWDQILIDKASALLQVSQNCVISGYPASFLFKDGIATPQGTTQSLLAHVLSPKSFFQNDSLCLTFNCKVLPSHLGAVEAFHIGGGCFFAPADLTQFFPWDPYMYFNEEEASMAIRLFTHGWTIYHVHGLPIMHLYTQPANTVVRPMHWDEKQEEGKDFPLWQYLIGRAQHRMKLLMSEDNDLLGVYALGKKRSLQDFAEYSGIDYINKKIAPKAYEGPWVF